MKKDDEQDLAELEKACRAAEEEYVRTGVLPLPEPIPHFSLGAFFMPPIWGAAHGQWITLLFYPLWVFCDSMLRTAYHYHTIPSIVGAVVITVAMAVVTIWFAATAQRPGYWRVHDRYTPEQYTKREKVWNAAMIAIAVVFLALATYYNLFMYHPAG